MSTQSKTVEQMSIPELEKHRETLRSLLRDLRGGYLDLEGEQQQQCVEAIRAGETLLRMVVGELTRRKSDAIRQIAQQIALGSLERSAAPIMLHPIMVEQDQQPAGEEQDPPCS